ASAVIEKDSIAGKLAADLKTDELLILTDVDYVCLNYGKENEEPIKNMTIAEAKKYIEEGQFGETDMLPKIMAAISYLETVPTGKAIITSLNKTRDMINEKVGTVITA
ncbi:MAG: carbamate kinase, partial [Lachnospiraceae bacterium]|nr:carbamate kinase [Lachnospiraceae bacterium]